MKYAEFVKQIKDAAKDQILTGFDHFISFYGETYKTHSSFLEDGIIVTQNQLDKAENAGLLNRDYDMYVVTKNPTVLRDFPNQKVTVYKNGPEILIERSAPNKISSFEIYRPI